MSRRGGLPPTPVSYYMTEKISIQGQPGVNAIPHDCVNGTFLLMRNELRARGVRHSCVGYRHKEGGAILYTNPINRGYRSSQGALKLGPRLLFS